MKKLFCSLLLATVLAVPAISQANSSLESIVGAFLLLKATKEKGLLDQELESLQTKAVEIIVQRSETGGGVATIKEMVCGSSPFMDYCSIVIEYNIDTSDTTSTKGIFTISVAVDDQGNPSEIVY